MVVGAFTCFRVQRGRFIPLRCPMFAIRAAGHFTVGQVFNLRADFQSAPALPWASIPVPHVNEPAHRRNHTIFRISPHLCFLHSARPVMPHLLPPFLGSAMPGLYGMACKLSGRVTPTTPRIRARTRFAWFGGGEGEQPALVACHQIISLARFGQGQQKIVGGIG